MILSLIAGGLMAQVPAAAPDTRITGVSMFKNGYAVVVRETPILADGSVSIRQIPQSSLGTLWFTASSGVKISDVVSSHEDKKGERDASSIDEILTANIGKEVRLGTRTGDSVTGPEIIGTISSVTGQIVVLNSPNGMIAVPKAIINSVGAKSGELLFKMPTYEQQRVIRIKTTGGAGKISMVSLERGITWAPAYAVDITDPDKLSIVGKATVLNDLADLDGIEARFVTGFPNIPFAGLPDPLTSGQPVDQFIAMINGIGSANFDRAPGSAGRAGEMMSQNAAAPGEDFFTSFDPTLLPGLQEGELFFYRRPDVRMKRGDRAYYVLFRAEAPYETLYTWDIDDSIGNDTNYRPIPVSSADDVWQSLRFKNTAGQPFTTAAATTFKNGQIIGQDMLQYTSAGAEAKLRITKALDLRAEHSEEEKARTRGALVLPNYGNYDLVTIHGTLELTNMKATKVKVKVTKAFTGELISATGEPKSAKVGKGLQQVNSRFALEWTKEVEPGKKLTISYDYKVYVR